MLDRADDKKPRFIVPFSCAVSGRMLRGRRQCRSGYSEIGCGGIVPVCRTCLARKNITEANSPCLRNAPARAKSDLQKQLVARGVRKSIANAILSGIGLGADEPPTSTRPISRAERPISVMSSVSHAKELLDDGSFVDAPESQWTIRLTTVQNRNFRKVGRSRESTTTDQLNLLSHRQDPRLRAKPLPLKAHLRKMVLSRSLFHLLGTLTISCETCFLGSMARSPRTTG